MKIVSWNVNGIRACIRKGFLDFVKKENPDIVCVQETKAQPSQVDLTLKEYPYHFWNSAKRLGYSGVAVFSKIKPISVKKGMGILDDEGRVLTLEFPDYFLITVYVPNSKQDLSRVDLRYSKWDKHFLEYIKSLKKPVIFCGDLNVAHEEIDLKNPQPNKTTATRPGNPGFTDKEREGFANFLNVGYVDTFRYFYPNMEKYSWWSYRFNARARNIGWRIDYFCVDKKLINRVKDSLILDEVTGSDHCPVELVLKD